MTPLALDHIAFWVADRKPIVERCERHLGMHVIDEEADFTLVGADARAGKLTFFDADGPRERGVVAHLELRVSDLRAAQALLPKGSGSSLELGEGLKVRLVEKPTEVEPDLDCLALLARDPELTAGAFEEYGFRRIAPSTVVVGDARLVFVDDGPIAAGAPLLNHLGLLVESAEEHRREAEERGLAIEKVVDAPNTLAVFLTGPEEIRLEYVEHKPTFALA
jgi:catechol 2,3-dioxygenase-like lactoylglutathione lyase family enzyme